MSATRKLNRRDFLRLSATAATGAVVAACAPATPMIVEKEVIREVPVEKVVEKEVIKEVPVEKIVEKEVVKEVAVEKVVKETVVVEKEVAAKPVEKARIRFMSRAHSQKGLMFFPQIIENHFEATHPGIQVDVEPAPSGWSQKLVAAMIAGNANDVFQAWPAIWYDWVERDLLLDIQPYVDRDVTQEELEDYIEAQWEALVIRGVRVGMPKYIDLRLETINKDLFDEAGVDYPPVDGDWTVDDMEEMGVQLTRDRSGDGEIDTWGIWVTNGGWFYWPRMWGGGIVNPDDETDCWMEEPTSQGAYKWLYRNQWEREPNILIRDEQGGGWYDGLVSQLIAIDEMGMYPAQTAEKVGDLFQWAYREPPAGPSGQCSLGDADGWSIWKGTKHPEACWELIYFLSGPVFQELGTLRAEGAIPIRKSLMPVMYEVFAEEFPVLADVNMEVVGQMLDKGYLSNVRWFKNQAAADEIIGPAIDAVFGVGEQDPSYFKEICAQVEAAQK